MKILIQFTGAQSSGKTTLVEELKKRAKVSYSYINEVPRDLFNSHIISHIDIKATFTEQLMIQHEFLLERYKAIGEGNDLILSCRSPMDVIAYGQNLKDANTTTLDTYVRTAAEKYLLYTLNRKDYKVITFYTEILDEFEEDGIRLKESNKFIDKTIIELLYHYKVPVTKLSNTSVEDRLRKIELVLKPYNLFNWD
jgi:predicted ATPase